MATYPTILAAMAVAVAFPLSGLVALGLALGSFDNFVERLSSNV